MTCPVQPYIAHQWISSDVHSGYIKLLLYSGDTRRCFDALYDTQEGGKKIGKKEM